MSKPGKGRPRVLFVDDESSIRLTLPTILEMHGFEVIACGTVSESLDMMQKERFDVLLADLNIGQPGDGFTVVSAMRRTQPAAVTIILTGFPAFETALEAIRNQVDDYVVKPANIDRLLQTIEERLAGHQQHRPIPLRRLGAILGDSVADLVRDWLLLVEADPELNTLPLSEQERADHVPAMLYETMDLLMKHPGTVSDRALDAAVDHGRARRRQGYTIPMILKEGRYVRRVITEMVQQNLLAVDISYLLGDLILASDAIDVQVKRAVEAFLEDARTPNPKAA